MTIRIIGGSNKKRKLSTFSGKDIRPTSDRLRESIFNIISPIVKNAVSLDLFAGTGALGIEALSRGACFCLFIDNNKAAIELIKTNIALCQFEEKAMTRKWDITKNLDCVLSLEKKFDLIFMDPPYHQDMISTTLHHLQRTQKITNGASIVIEHAISEAIPESLSCFQVMDQRRYGKTEVSVLKYNTV